MLFTSAYSPFPMAFAAAMSSRMSSRIQREALGYSMVTGHARSNLQFGKPLFLSIFPHWFERFACAINRVTLEFLIDRNSRERIYLFAAAFTSQDSRHCRLLLSK
jgi:hypothetical protein